MRTAGVTSPLAGKRVLIARPEGQTEGPAKLLRDRGAVPVVIPCIVIGPPDDEEALKQALQPERIAATDWVVLTSANGVSHAWSAMAEQRLPPLRGEAGTGAATQPKLAVVGTATEAALLAHGVTADIVAKESRGEGLAAALIPLLPRKDVPPRVLVLRAQEASDVLPDALLAAGAVVDVVAAYRTRTSPEGAAEVKARLSRGEIDVVIFSSGSTVTSICDALSPEAAALLDRVTVACIGPVTATAARERRVRVDVVPGEPTFLAAILALEIHFRAY